MKLKTEFNFSKYTLTAGAFKALAVFSFVFSVAPSYSAVNEEQKDFQQIQSVLKDAACSRRGEGVSYVFKSTISEDFLSVDYSCPRKLRIRTKGALIPNIEFITNGNEAWRAVPELPSNPDQYKSALLEHYWSLEGYDFSLLFEVFPPLREQMLKFQKEQYDEAQRAAVDAHNFKYYVKDGFKWVELLMAKQLLPPYKLLFKFTLGDSDLVAIHVDISKHLEHLKFERVSKNASMKFSELHFNPRIPQEYKITYYPKRKWCIDLAI